MKLYMERVEEMNIKYYRTVLLIVVFSMLLLLSGCGDEASRVSYNLSQEANNFNVVRQITVINCIKGDTLFQMTGKMSIHADTNDNQLEVIVEDDGTYTKHFIGLSDNVTYIVEDLDLGANDVNKYHYTINYNPNMWIPANLENVD